MNPLFILKSLWTFVVSIIWITVIPIGVEKKRLYRVIVGVSILPIVKGLFPGISRVLVWFIIYYPFLKIIVSVSKSICRANRCFLRLLIFGLPRIGMNVRRLIFMEYISRGIPISGVC